uniref:Uncharacterized protein n=1 Tax=Fagus sylvatica TaxID=28930 RepID=A0A2N9F1R3_FAGSY
MPRLSLASLTSSPSSSTRSTSLLSPLIFVKSSHALDTFSSQCIHSDSLLCASVVVDGAKKLCRASSGHKLHTQARSFAGFAAREGKMAKPRPMGPCLHGIHGHGATVTPSTVRSAQAHRARSDAGSTAEGRGHGAPAQLPTGFFFLSLCVSHLVN